MYGRGDCGRVKGVGLFWEEKGGGLNRREHWGDSERKELPNSDNSWGANGHSAILSYKQTGRNELILVCFANH